MSGRLTKPVLVVVFSALALAVGAFAGSLTPPGAVGSTMHSLANIYDSIASATFDSSGIVANQNGSLIASLKYIENQTAWASSSGNIWNLNSGNVGIASSSPDSLLTVRGGNISQVARTNPVEVGRISGIGTPFSVDVANGIAYVADYDDIRIIDISNPASPSLMSTFVTPGSASWAQVAGKYLYIADANAVRIADISNPTSPVLVGSVQLSSSSPTAVSPWVVRVSGHYLFAADYTGAKKRFIDVSNPSNPRIVNSQSGPASAPYDFAVSGNYLYVAENNSGFSIWDVSNPASPVFVGNGTGFKVTGLDVIGRYLYTTGTTSRVYDLKNPASPVLVTTFAGGYKLRAQGRYLYVYSGAPQLYVYDVTNPASPNLIGTYTDTAGSAAIVAASIVGEYAYLADYGGTSLVVVKLNGTETPNILTGGLQAGNINVLQDAVIGGGLFARSGLNVGGGGMLVTGEGAIESFSSSSALTLIQRGRGNLLSLTSSASQIFYIQASSSGNVNMTLQSPSAPGTDGKFTLRSAGVSDRLDILNGANSALVSIASTGNVGIGTSSPDAKLRVIGTAEFGDSVASAAFGKLVIGLDSGTNDRQISLMDGNGGMSFYRQRASYPCCGIFLSDTVSYANFTSEKFTTQHPAADIEVLTDSNWNGLGTIPASIIFFTAVSSKSHLYERMRVTSSGNIGIGVGMDPVTNASVVDSLLEIRASDSFTTSNIASISAVGLTTGTALSIRVPTISTFSGGIFRAVDIVGRTLASISAGGSLELAGYASVSSTLSVTGDGTVDMLKLSESDSLKTYGMVVRDGDLYLRAPSSSAAFSSRWNLLAVASNSLGITLATPASPSIVGTYYPGPSLAYKVDVSGKYAYIAAQASGLLIVDVSIPSSPSFVGSYDTSGNANNVQVVGKYAYVVDSSDGLIIVDVSDPSSPKKVGNIAISFSPQDVYVSGRYAYVTSGANGLRIIDISNPTSPVLVKSFVHTSGTTYGVYVSGRYAYVADGSTFAALRVWDLTNISAPVEVGAASASYAFDVYVSGRYAYVADYTSGFRIFDISHPTRPTLISTTDTPGQAYDIRVHDKYAYVSDRSGGLRIYDISNPAAPTLAGRVAVTDATGAVIAGSYAYIADFTSGGLRVVDIGGVRTFALSAGSLQASNIGVTENMDIGNNLYIRGGLNVGPGGFQVQGFTTFSSASYFGGNVGIGTTAPEAKLEINGTASISNGFFVSSVGNVGIGTTNPIRKLDIYGSNWVNGSGGDLRTIGTGTVGGALTLISYPNSVSVETAFSILATGPGAPMGTGSFAVWDNQQLAYRFVINANGNVGIGTTTPTALLEVEGTASVANDLFVSPPGYTGNVGVGTSTPDDVLAVRGTFPQFSLNDGTYISAMLGATGCQGGEACFAVSSVLGTIPVQVSLAASTSSFVIRANSHIGLGTDNPTAFVQISSKGFDGQALLRLEDINSTCDFTANAGGPTCGSDIRLKMNVTAVSDGVLDRLLAVHVVNYHWKTDTDASPVQTGFIAQNVQEYFPDLVATASWIDGKPALFLSQNAFIPYLVKGIQELTASSLLLDQLLKTDTISTEPSGPLARLVHNILAFISDVFGVTIEDGGVRNRDHLCVGDACVTKEQFLQMIERSGVTSQSGATTTASPTPTPTPSVESTPVPDSTPTPDATAPTPTPTEAPVVPTDTPVPPPTDTPSATP